MKIAYAVPMTWACDGILAPFAQADELLARGHAVTIFAPAAERIDWFPLRAPLESFAAEPEVQGAFDAIIFAGDTFRKVRFPGAKRQFLFLQGKDHLWARPDERAALLEAYSDPRFHILAVSCWLRDFVHDRCGNPRVSVIGNGVDLSRFHPIDSHRERFRLLIEGNFPDRRKNVLDAIEIASRVRQHKAVEIWGMGRRFAATGSLVDRVFEDPAPEAIPGIYQQCDVLIKTPVAEGFSLPYLEAMACGCVPVTYSAGVVLDFCAHNENSLLAGVGNLPLMVWNVLRFLSDSALRTRLRENTLATARRYPWSRTADLLEEALTRELGSP